MPSSSAKQSRFMAAIAHNPSFAKKVGVSQSVGKDFSAADKGKTFNKGGIMKKRRFDEGGDVSDYEIDPDSRRAHGFYDEEPAAKPKSETKAKAKAKVKTKAKDYGDEGDRLRARKGDTEDQFKGVSRASRLMRRDDAAGIKQPSTAEAADKPVAGRSFMSEPLKRLRERMSSGDQQAFKPRNFKKGGMMKESKEMTGKEVAFMKKKGAPKSMIKHEKAEMGMAKGGMPMKDGKPAFMKKFAKGGGIEARGKTKGTIIRMASGGSVSSASRRSDGIAQRGKTRC